MGCKIQVKQANGYATEEYDEGFDEVLEQLQTRPFIAVHINKEARLYNRDYVVTAFAEEGYVHAERFDEVAHYEELADEAIQEMRTKYPDFVGLEHEIGELMLSDKGQSLESAYRTVKKSKAKESIMIAHEPHEV